MPDYKKKLADLERLVIGNHINQLCEEATTLVSSLAEDDKSAIFKELYTETGEFSDGENLDIVFPSHKYLNREKVTFVVVLLIKHGLPLDTKLDNNKTLLKVIVSLKKDNAYRKNFIKAIFSRDGFSGCIGRALGNDAALKISAPADFDCYASDHDPCLQGMFNLFSRRVIRLICPDSKRLCPDSKRQASHVKKNQ